MAREGLDTITQSDFSGGIWRSRDRAAVPPNTCYDILNWFVDTAGNLVKRGGRRYYLGQAVANNQHVFFWDGYLRVGHRIVVAASENTAFVEGHIAIHNGSSYTTVETDSAEIIVDRPRQEAVLNGVLVLRTAQDYGAANESFYFTCGSTKANYTTGTATFTNGSKVVTGVGTTWSTKLEAGMFIYPSTGSSDPRIIESVDSNTKVTLTHEWDTTTFAASAYVARSDGFNSLIHANTAAEPIVAPGGLATVGRRLLCATATDIVSFSLIDQPTRFDSGNFHKIPGGGRNLGIADLDGDALVFTSAGVWRISGLIDEIEDDLGNPLHAVRKVSDSLILWDDAGIASWENRVVVPCTDGVYMFDGVSAPIRISDGIEPIYREYVEDATPGGVPGRAVIYKDYYLLPIINPTAATPEVVPIEALACRLTPTVTPDGRRIYPWFRIDTSDHGINAFAVRHDASAIVPPKLLGNSHTGNIWDMTGIFSPSATVPADDGVPFTADSYIESTVTTRDFKLTDNSSGALVKRVVIDHELSDDGSLYPFTYVSGNADGAASGPTSGELPEGSGAVGLSAGARANRFRLTISNNAELTALAVIRSISLKLRPTARDK